MSTDVRTDPPTGRSRDRTGPTPPPVTKRKPGTAGPRRGATPGTKRASGAVGSDLPAPATEEQVSSSPSEPAAPASSARGSRLPWILAVLGLLGTVVFAGAWLGARGDHGGTASTASDTGAVRSAATRFSEALTNFDGATIGRDFDRLLDLSTGDFQDQADQFFSTKTRGQLKEAQASSRGEVRDAYVQDVRGRRATVFVVVDQTIANNKTPTPKADTLRMELTLQADGGRWLVSRVNVLEAPLAGALATEGSGG